MSTTKLIAIPLLLIIAFAFGFFGHFLLLNSDNVIKAGGIKTEGVISQIIWRKGKKGADITFRTLEGKVVTEMYDGIFWGTVGSRRTIYYNPYDPEEITVGKSFNMAYVFFIISGFCVLGAGQLGFSCWRDKKKRKVQKKK